MDNHTYYLPPPTGSTDFGPPLLSEEQVEDLDKHYAGMAALVAAIAAAIGSIIYASKHIKSSSCLGNKCEQQVVVEKAVTTESEV